MSENQFPGGMTELAFAGLLREALQELLLVQSESNVQVVSLA